MGARRRRRRAPIYKKSFPGRKKFRFRRDFSLVTRLLTQLIDTDRDSYGLGRDGVLEPPRGAKLRNDPYRRIGTPYRYLKVSLWGSMNLWF